MLHQVKNRKQEGFTIIEVLIVLAIAGLILLIVFLAVPALQRNSRNTQRKNDASHLAGLISEWQSNNAGTTPTGFGSGAGKISLTGENFATITAPTAITAATSGGTIAVPAVDTAAVYTNATCTNNAATYTASARAIAIYYGLEGSTTTGCVTAG